MTDERLIFDKHGVPRPNPAFPEPAPTDEPEQFTGEVFEARVVSYFLGQLSEEEAKRFEDECFAQEYWPSRINLAEEDLIDAYLHDELAPEQHQCFEQNYMISEGRQRRVRLAAALLRQTCEREAVVAEPVAVERDSETWVRRMRAFWVGRAWPLPAGYAVAVVAIIVCAAWLYISRVQQPPVVASLKLTSTVEKRSKGAEGADVRSIKLPSNADALRVELMFPSNAAPAPVYRVELDNKDEGESKSLAISGQDAQSVSVLIPASRLVRGDYALRLVAVKNGEEQVYSYFFSVE